MRKLAYAAVATALLVPAGALAQDAQIQTNGSMSDSSSTESAVGTAAKYTIDVRPLSQMPAGGGTDAAGNAAPGAVESTLRQNPGLAEALEQKGVKVDAIGAISVQPNDVVVVYSKT